MSGHRELFPSGVEGACVTDTAGRREGTALVWLRNFLALILLLMPPTFMGSPCGRAPAACHLALFL